MIPYSLHGRGCREYIEKHTDTRLEKAEKRCLPCLEMIRSGISHGTCMFHTSSTLRPQTPLPNPRAYMLKHVAPHTVTRTIALRWVLCINVPRGIQACHPFSYHMPYVVVPPPSPLCRRRPPSRVDGRRPYPEARFEDMVELYDLEADVNNVAGFTSVELGAQCCHTTLSSDSHGD